MGVVGVLPERSSSLIYGKVTVALGYSGGCAQILCQTVQQVQPNIYWGLPGTEGHDFI